MRDVETDSPFEPQVIGVGIHKVFLFDDSFWRKITACLECCFLLTVVLLSVYLVMSTKKNNHDLGSTQHPKVQRHSAKASTLQLTPAADG